VTVMRACLTVHWCVLACIGRTGSGQAVSAGAAGQEEGVLLLQHAIQMVCLSIAHPFLYCLLLIALLDLFGAGLSERIGRGRVHSFKLFAPEEEWECPSRAPLPGPPPPPPPPPAPGQEGVREQYAKLCLQEREI
jgi:hypothetical protein